MRTLLLLFIASMLIGCSVMNNNSLCREDKSNRATLFKIKSIKDKGEFYIIYAKRDGFLYKIFSKLEREDKFKTIRKLKRKANGEKIKVGRYYDLKLEKFFPLDSIFGIAIAPNAGIVGFDYGGKTVYVERKSHYSIYRAKNLRGLYLDNDLNR